MHFDDLSVYNYYVYTPLEEVRCIGWIDSRHPYTRGSVPESAVQKLELVTVHRNSDFDAHVNILRGTHPCNFCMNDITISHNEQQYFLGNSEIWIPYESGWLAAPSLVSHYMRHHDYSPPSVFLRAIQELDINAPYRAQGIYERLIANR